MQWLKVDYRDKGQKVTHDWLRGELRL
eukprot:COSAG02_NODE_48209_length_335_cov_0.911017_2_plen_26_part_01